MRSDTLFDTNIVVDYLRGLGAAVAFATSLSSRPSVSVVTVTEVFAGVRRRQEEVAARAFFSQSSVAPVLPEIAERAGVFLRHYRSSHGVGFADALIAATAEHHGLELATPNVRHFPMFKGLRPAY